MVDRVGQDLGNYRLVRLLGRGGFAEVYLGEHRRLNTRAAIKLLHTQVSREDEEDFLNEAKTIALLEHPHIVRILDFDIFEGLPFLVMHYAPNGNLRQFHSKGTRLPFSTVVNYLTQITRALQYAHDEKFIHRDIKPENILLGRHNELLLSDFGIALIAQSSRLQSIQDVVGTAAYIAPEQLQGKPRFASDQYSLGILVYEWLVGERPFQGSFVELYSQHLSVPPPSIHEKVPTLPPVVDEVVQIALAKDPGRRFGSVSAFATALQEIERVQRSFSVEKPVSISPPLQESEPIPPVSQVISASSWTPPVPASSWTPPVRIAAELETPPPLSFQRGTQQSSPSSFEMQASVPPRQIEYSEEELVIPGYFSEEKEPVGKQGISRRHLLVGGVGALVLAGGVGALVIQRGATPLSVQLPHGTFPLIYKGHTDAVKAVAWSLDGKQIASAGNDGTVQLWDTTQGNVSFIFRGYSSVYAVVWSLDGKQIASAGYTKNATAQNGIVKVWNAATKSVAVTIVGNNAPILTVGWSPEGQRIVFASSDGRVQIWNIVTQKVLYVYAKHTGAVNGVAWSPDGKDIASAGSDGTVQVWTVVDGHGVYTYKGYSGSVSYMANAVRWSPDGKRIASASPDGTVQVWNAANGSAPFIYKGHTGAVNGVAWSPDGKRIASASADGTVRIWNASDGSVPFAYKGHKGAVNAVAWSPDGKYIASAGADKTVQTWKAP